MPHFINLLDVHKRYLNQPHNRKNSLIHILFRMTVQHEPERFYDLIINLLFLNQCRREKRI